MALLEVNFFSDVLGLCTSMNVILPQNSDETACLRNDDGTYPVLYLLHGMSDDHTAWIRKTSIDRYAEKYGVAIVMPTTHLGWYTDMDMGYKYFTFLTEELPEICRSFFPKISPKREHTFAAGLSMGGYGALRIGLKHPERYSRIGSFSSGIGIPQEYAKGGFRALSGETIFGDPDKVIGSDYDGFYMAEKRAQSGEPLPPVYISCGTKDRLYGINAEYRDHLIKLGYPVTWDEGPYGHEWRFWDEQVEKFIATLPDKK